MPDFRFFHPIEVRYGDLDPQGHVNNACYLTYMEQARIAYIQALGLWPGGTFLDIGIILAEAQVVFNSPILYGQKLRVGVRVSRLGNKSLTMDYLLEDVENGKRLASGTSTLVTYDYHDSHTMPIPEDWRRTIESYEALSNHS